MAEDQHTATLTCVVVQDAVERIVHQTIDSEVARMSIGLPGAAPGCGCRLTPPAGLQTAFAIREAVLAWDSDQDFNAVMQ